jgi:hypothetical protein
MGFALISVHSRDVAIQCSIKRTASTLDRIAAPFDLVPGPEGFQRRLNFLLAACGRSSIGSENL